MKRISIFMLVVMMVFMAKLAPDAAIGEGLAVSYPGGSDLPDDLSKLLEKNGIKK